MVFLYQIEIQILSLREDTLQIYVIYLHVKISISIFVETCIKCYHERRKRFN
ncbi:hypothetical protein DET65_0190 [Sunxiuqinia elliptica]|uniref:Uncharacterized protein n=1 Tax=Sunxiuqinia elliptica TaxID=655355 RepID=A0A4R6GMX4_9BACT|nr:hypothetical protein DET52_1136 [Sunxiuqinia elliptica]TDO67726.1 hypothetical protein DET65_0190 [Sunxiuqinia elliptica]